MALGLGFSFGLGRPKGLLAVIIGPPSLDWDDDESDSRPDFDVIFPNGVSATYDTAVNDVLRIEYSSDGGGVWHAYLTHTFISDDIAATPFSVAGVSPLASDDYLFRARIERGSNVSAWSASEAVTVDAVSGTYYIYGF